MKAILVIDMPETCDDCPLTEWAGGYCRLAGMFVAEDERPSWCPLKPMPQKMRTDANDIEEDSYWQGWNSCLEEIMGETE